MIRLIREISGQLNIIHTRIYFFRTLIERIKRILQVCDTCFIKEYCLISTTAAASGHACKSVLNPYINQRTKVKKIRVKDSVCIRAIRELFLTFVL